MAVPVALLVLAGISAVVVTQWDRLPFDSLQSNNSPSDLGRFEGLDGMTVDPADISMYWWLRPTVEETVTAEDLPEEFTVENPDDLVQRTVLPSGITFRADSAELSVEALANIKTAAASIPKDFIRITVLCHSSADGTKESRLPLSQERAEVLADELENILGVASGSIVRMGLGDQYPVAGIDPESPTGRLVNRRCEILVES